MRKEAIDRWETVLPCSRRTRAKARKLAALEDTSMTELIGRLVDMYASKYSHRLIGQILIEDFGVAPSLIKQALEKQTKEQIERARRERLTP